MEADEAEQAVGELVELLNNCSGRPGFTIGAASTLAAVFNRLVELVPPEEARDIIEEVWYACQVEGGG